MSYGLEEPDMVGGDGEVEPHCARAARGVLRAFGQLFFEGRARGAVGVGVEGEDGLGEGAVVHALGANHGGDDVLMAPCLAELLCPLVVQTAAGGVEFGLEGQSVETVDNLRGGGAGRGSLVGAVHEGEHGLEHAGGGAGGGDELQDVAAVAEELRPARLGVFGELVVGDEDAVVDARR